MVEYVYSLERPFGHFVTLFHIKMQQYVLWIVTI